MMLRKKENRVFDLFHKIKIEEREKLKLFDPIKKNVILTNGYFSTFIVLLIRFLLFFFLLFCFYFEK